MGTLYDLNKSALATAKALNVEQEFLKKKSEFIEYLTNKGNKFYMLLCNEQKDYTIFQQESVNSHFQTWSILQECLENRGDLLSFEATADGIAYEIWLRIEDEIFVYYFFPYDDAVIRC
jgi:hypothetical protein